jgi:hypothetical protein
MVVLLILLCGVAGLLIYAKYHDCDPLKAKLVTRSDQVMIFWLIIWAYSIVISAVLSSICYGNIQSISWSNRTFHCFCHERFSEVDDPISIIDHYHSQTNFSTISSGVNSIAAVIIEDIWKPLTPNRPLSDKLQTKISKYICKRWNGML